MYSREFHYICYIISSSDIIIYALDMHPTTFELIYSVTPWICENLCLVAFWLHLPWQHQLQMGQ